MENNNKSSSELHTDKETQKNRTEDKNFEKWIQDNGKSILALVEEETGEDQETRLKRLAKQSIEEKKKEAEDKLIFLISKEGFLALTAETAEESLRHFEKLDDKYLEAFVEEFEIIEDTFFANIGGKTEKVNSILAKFTALSSAIEKRTKV